LWRIFGEMRPICTEKSLLNQWAKFEKALSAVIARPGQLGLHPGDVCAVLAIIVELVGPTLVISGYFVWLGAGALGVLTVIAAAAAHSFWSHSTGSGCSSTPSKGGIVERPGSSGRGPVAL
jgi:uncharacterized membrane protein YphA (DoxX/SURF4 family)